MKPEIKTGDLLECVNDAGVGDYLSKGNYYRAGNTMYDTKVWVVHDRGNTDWFLTSRFVVVATVTPADLMRTIRFFAEALVREPPLKVGDTVKYCKSSPMNTREYEIVHIERSHAWIEGAYRPGFLEHIKNLVRVTD